MSEFDFSCSLGREGTNCSKWDGRQAVFGQEDVLPLWVADMDFAVGQAISEAISKRAKHPVYGYNLQPASLYEAIAAWIKRRHGWTIEENWLVTSPGVVPAIGLAILALTQPGDGIIIQPPVYPPFFSTITDNERKVVENPLVNRNGYYEIDFAQLEELAADPANKALLLCSPHNPVGRVWTKEELSRVYELCQRHQVTVLSDEIHCDLVHADARHIPYASLTEAAADHSVTFMAASKTFNIAGLNFSYMIVPCAKRRAAITSWINRLHLRRNNLFGVVATETAYREGEAWLEALLAYIQQNAELAVRLTAEKLPGVTVWQPEGTYLLWLDFRKYFSRDEELRQFLIQDAKVGLNAGKTFGVQGEGFVRLNLGTSAAVVEDAFSRMGEALKRRGKL